MTDALAAALERAQAFRAGARALGPPGVAAALEADLVAWRARADDPLRAALDAAIAALATAGRDLTDAHERLLGGRGNSVACRETAYADPRRIAPTDLADLAGFLRAFGFETRESPPDHVVVECELASLLALKEAYALSEGWPERAAIARTAYERLVGDHLARWLPRFAARLAAAAPGSFHAAAAEAVALLVASEAERLGVALESTEADLAPSALDASAHGEFVCGASAVCTGEG